jgi:hypothetical protein
MTRHHIQEWDISSTRLLLDADLNTDNLGWKFGDYFKLIEQNGRAVMVRVDPLEKFLDDGTKKNG